MKIRALALLTAVSAFPGLAMAETYRCEFTQECFETEACADTSFTLDFDHAKLADQGLGKVLAETKIVSSSETIMASQISSQDGKTIGFWAARANGDQHLGTVAEDGTARYSIHMPTSEVALFYKGMCKPTN